MGKLHKWRRWPAAGALPHTPQLLQRAPAETAAVHASRTAAGGEKAGLLRRLRLPSCPLHFLFHAAARGIYFDMWQMQRAQQALESHLRHDDNAAGGGNGGSSFAEHDGGTDAEAAGLPARQQRTSADAADGGSGSDSDDEEGDQAAAELAAADLRRRRN